MCYLITSTRLPWPAQFWVAAPGEVWNYASTAIPQGVEVEVVPLYSMDEAVEAGSQAVSTDVVADCSTDVEIL